MGVTAKWYDPQETIIHYVYDPVWTWDEFRAAFEQANAMAHSKPYPVSVILDMSASRGVPNGAMTEIRRFTDRANDGSRNITIVVTDRGLGAVLLKTFLAINRSAAKRYFHANTLADAVHMIRMHKLEQ